MKKVVVIGGGTGTYTVLTGLKNYNLDISAVVSMMDSGGSTGRLRDQLGVLPPGDLRQCLVALSEAPDLWRKLFLYRFESGDLLGHNFGNIFITALEKIAKDYDEVLEHASFILGTKGKVLPVTLDKAHLCVEYEDGEIVKGEGLIDKAQKTNSRIRKAYLDPGAQLALPAKKALEEADFIIFGPGDLYTSVIPNIITKGFGDTLLKSEAKLIYIVNLVTKKGQTTDYKASDHVLDIERYLGKKINFILINDSQIPKFATEYYEKDDEKVVENDLEKLELQGRFQIRGDFLSDFKFEKSPVDKSVRSLLRHDPHKLAASLISIMTESSSFKNKVRDALSDIKSYIVD
ncbi:MAG: gluconeogenesis factor YvcK family protein [Patescibacteria group bacterium]